MENFPKELFTSKDVAGFEKYIIDNGIGKDDWLTTNHHTLLLYTLLYKKYKDYEIRYYITERSIRDKIKMMKSFIDKCNYKYLFLS